MSPEVGTVIRSARERNGLDQAELAALAGTSQAHVSRIERGHTSPSVETAARLLRVMGERLLLDGRPLPRGNRSATELRAEFDRTTPADRLAQAAALSYLLTSIASGAASSGAAS